MNTFKLPFSKTLRTTPALMAPKVVAKISED